MTGERPNSCTNLNKALLRLAGSDESFLDVRATLANVIVGQLLPDCVVKSSGSSDFPIQSPSRSCRLNIKWHRSCTV